MTNLFDRQDYFSQYLKEKGIELSNPFEIKECQIKINPYTFYDFVDKNKNDKFEKFYEPRPFFDYDSMKQVVMAQKLGYCKENTLTYDWGIEEKHSDSLKDLLGQDAFKVLQLEEKTAMVKLLQFQPGTGIPLHTDLYAGFREKNNVPEGEGNITRFFVAVSPWSWGHFLQIHDKMIHHWNPGHCVEIPEGIFHLSANFGIEPKLSLSITGTRLK